MTPRIRFLAIAAIAVAGVGIAYFLFNAPPEGGGGGGAEGGKTVWNYSVWGPPRAFTSGIEHTKAILEEAGHGTFELKIHYAGAIAPAKEHLDAIKIGLIEGAHICVGYNPGKTPLAQVLELPFLLTDDIAVNARIMAAVFSHPLIEEELARGWNTKYMQLALLSRYEFMGSKRIAAAADFQGVRVRISGGNASLLAEYGAVATMVTAPETYTALERGTVDVVGFPWTDSFGVFRLYEVSQYVTDGVAMSGFACISGVSLDAWNALPAQLQAELPRIREEGIAAMIQAYKDGDRTWEPIFRERLEIVPFPESERQMMVRRADQVWRKWAAETDAKGLAGSEILAYTIAQRAKFSR